MLVEEHNYHVSCLASGNQGVAKSLVETHCSAQTQHGVVYLCVWVCVRVRVCTSVCAPVHVDPALKEKKKEKTSSHTGNRTRAAAVRAPNPNH